MAREIPKGQWNEFLTDFTVDNEGRRATLEIGDEVVLEGEGEDSYVLTGVEAGVQAEGEDTVVLAFADMEGEDQKHVTHRFEHVRSMRLHEESDMPEGLELETRDGTRAVLHLAEERIAPGE